LQQKGRQLHETFRELLAGFSLDVNEDHRQLDITVHTLPLISLQSLPAIQLKVYHF
jgi:hypothetical protein